jgi:signal peptidase II
MPASRRRSRPLAASESNAENPAGAEAAGGISAFPGPPRVSARALLILVAVAVVVYAADQLAKAWVVANLTPFQSVPVLGEVLQFVFVRNSGAAFSLASGSTWVFSIVAAAVTVFIVWFARRIRSLGWAVLFGMLLGGTTGNLTDRLFREPGFGVGHVVDFISVWAFPAIFNVADIAIVSSMGLFLILTLRGVGLDGSRVSRRARSSEDAPSAHG